MVSLHLPAAPNHEPRVSLHSRRCRVSLYLRIMLYIVIYKRKQISKHARAIRVSFGASIDRLCLSLSALNLIRKICRWSPKARYLKDCTKKLRYKCTGKITPFRLLTRLSINILQDSTEAMYQRGVSNRLTACARE
jgi:hypothetical protein